MFNKKYFSWLISTGLLLFFTIVILFISQNILEEKNSWENKLKEVRIGENVFQAEIAATPAKRRQGLSGRKELCENCAMIFLFDERGLHSFWMKEMSFGLDIIWIDKEKIVHIAKNVSQKKEFEIIKPEREADKVLEINAGLADKLGIKIGDKVEF